jgi:lantibiotic biosynthesis protein
LSLMSLSLLSGVSVPGQRQSIEKLCQWLIQTMIQDPTGANWPGGITFDTTGSVLTCQAHTRSGWCYGVPGVARSIWLAGNASENDQWKLLSLSAMNGALTRCLSQGLDETNFCHGIAGILHIALRFARDTRSAQLIQHCESLMTLLLSRYDAHSQVGYRQALPDGTWFDNAALLEGSAGIALVLVSATKTHKPTWERMFLIS